MPHFPDAYKARLFAHSADLLEVARAILKQNPDLNIHTAATIVTTAHLDMTVALVFNSIQIHAPVARR